MQIRKAQMQALSEYMLDRFEDRMVAHLRSRFPEQTQKMQEPDLRAFIRDGIDRARTYGVTKEFDVRRYLECMVTFGAEFDTEPQTSWAGDILRSEGLTGTGKMDWIDDHATFALREAQR